MRKFYLAFVFSSLLILLLGTGVRAQTTLAFQSFEGAATDTWSFTPTPATYNVSGDVWAITDDVININDASEGTMFWGMRDLNNPNGGGNFDHVLLFGDISTAGETDIELAFDWNVDQLNTGSDYIKYEVIIDGTGEGEVDIAVGAPDDINDTGWNTITVVIPDGTTSVGLRLIGKMDGGSDGAGFDNVLLTSDSSADPCGITAFGPTATATCTTFGTDPDTYSLSIDYTGVDNDAVLAVSVEGAPVAFDASTGSDLTADTDGTLVLTSAAFVEGTSYEVVLTDGGGGCNFTVSGSVALDACVATCDLSTDASMLRLVCTTLTAGIDGVLGSLDYTGIEPGAVATITGGAFIANATNPGLVADGEINFGPLVEGGSYTITIAGGACSGGDAIVIAFSVPATLCMPSDLVINEVLPNPTGGVDVNMDGATDSDDEFVELYNNGTTDIDISGYTLEDFAGIRHTFVPGTILLPGNGILVIADAGALAADAYECDWVTATVTFIGLNNTGTDGVVIRDASGNVVAQMTYTDAPAGESLALSPDGNVAGGYQNHSAVSSTGALSSPCSENIDNSIGLPIELLSFTATAAAKSVTLDWATANEVANDRFVIERSQNATQWSPIGTVRAGGRSAGDYVFTDEQPLDGRNLYRLRQIDLDGSFALYGPVQVTFTAAELSVFPNPAGNELRFNRQLEAATITLLEGTGRTLRNVTVANGRMDVSNLRPGIYLVRVEQGNTVETLRFVKQ